VTARRTLPGCNLLMDVVDALLVMSLLVSQHAMRDNTEADCG
jgi:hypothetical protein